MSAPLDRERYVQMTSDRLHDRFLERPAFLDLDFIRSEMKKLDSRIEVQLALEQPWAMIMNRLGEPTEYADAIYAKHLLSPEVAAKAPRSSLVVTVLKILFVIAPVNFIFAIGPLFIGVLIFVLGWIASAILVIGPLMFLVRFALVRVAEIGSAEVLFLIALFALGQLFALFMMIVSRAIFAAVWAWLGWNINFLRAEPRS
jgi:uncharacterized membrane protein